MIICLVFSNMNFIFHNIYMGMSSSQLTFTPSFFRGVGQPPTRLYIHIYIYTLWLFNIAMENGPFMDDFPTKTSIYKGFSMAMLNNHIG